MALPAKTQMKYWGIAAVVSFGLLWFLGDILLPFILGSAIAYCLDPIADRLERMGLTRALSVLVISVLFALTFVVVSLLIVPNLVRQTVELVNAIPDLVRQLRDFISAHMPGGISEGSPFGTALSNLGDVVSKRGTELLNGVLGSALTVINILMLFFIVPVVAVYMLIDWDRLVARIDDLLPRDHAPTIRRLAGEIDRTLSQFIRGQGLVCLIQGTFYAVALMLAGLKFGLVVGVVAGLLSFIPLVGALTGGLLAIGLAVFQFWGDPLHIGLVAGIFFFGQAIEGNVLTPKLVGSSVGLHPVVLLLALSVFGAMFGFVGMLVAVPLAAMLGVLVRFLIAEYKTGRLYRGLDAVPRDDSAAQDPHAAE
jgi:predicted PurR-regulated permease PerM